MKPQHMSWYLVALIALIIGAIAIGVPVSTLLLLLVVLACPLMMMFMMGGGHGHGSHDDFPDSQDHRDSAGRS